MEQQERILAAVRRHTLRVLPDLDPEAVTVGTSLAELGCNSIDRAEIVTLTMEELDVTVPVVEFAQVHNLRTLVDVLRNHL
jgi:polyketide biosynthesis acyl carrier protein